MSYPDEWNHASALDSILDLKKALDQLGRDKDEAIKNADYPAAAAIRDQMDEVRKRLAKGESEVKFKSHPCRQARWVKMLVVQDPLTAPTRSIMEAQLVISKNGRVIKDRHGELAGVQLDLQRHHMVTPDLVAGLEKALDCLSGDLNYDNVAKAKQILKNLLK